MIRVTDLDSSFVIDPENPVKVGQRAYTKGYFPSNDKYMTKKSDCFAVGMILYVLFTRTNTINFNNLTKILMKRYSPHTAQVRRPGFIL